MLEAGGDCLPSVRPLGGPPTRPRGFFSGGWRPPDPPLGVPRAPTHGSPFESLRVSGRFGRPTRSAVTLPRPHPGSPFESLRVSGRRWAHSWRAVTLPGPTPAHPSRASGRAGGGGGVIRLPSVRPLGGPPTRPRVFCRGAGAPRAPRWGFPCPAPPRLTLREPQGERAPTRGAPTFCGWRGRRAAVPGTPHPPLSRRPLPQGARRMRC